MKIAIPIDEKSLEGAVCASFGRTPFFLVYDTEAKKADYLVNDAANAQGGAGIKAAQFLVDAHADAILTVRCGENAAQVLQAAGIKIYKTAKQSAKDNINAFEKNKLEILSEIHPGFHGRG